MLYQQSLLFSLGIQAYTLTLAQYSFTIYADYPLQLAYFTSLDDIRSLNSLQFK
jgi:hypothetical protein